MSESRAPEPGPEITVDLTDDADHARPPTPVARFQVPNALVACIAVLLAVAAGGSALWKWSGADTPAAEAAVRSFLEAVRDGDADSAIALTDRSGLAPAAFLTPEALDARWSIVEVAQVSYAAVGSGRGGAAEAVVYAEIQAYDGTRLGNRFTVRTSGHDLVIENAISETDYHLAHFDHLEINGFDGPIPGPRPLRLFPGLYEFYETAPETLDPSMPPVLALGDKFIELGGTYTTSWPAWFWPRVTDHGHEVLADRIRAFFDGCAADPSAADCPFAAPSGAAAGPRIADDAEWIVVAYPEATVDAYSWSSSGYELVTARPGEARVEATVTGEDGRPREAVLSCPLWVEGMYALFEYDGDVGVTVGSAADRECRSMVAIDGPGR